ncbi:phage distal tail protein [Streptosporangium jomthongense]|uniref:Siphovirus-type tail component C-terminal domain-containing protein n=1 Tax=Streptosporangium jomthongense TaxID=1193683 RepID=A0ABV8EV63_9ACTN
MTVGIATSPALVQRWTTGTLTTAAFNAAAQTVLVACVAAFNAAPTVTSGGGLTWTRRVQRVYSGAYHEIWTAPCAAGASGITASVTGSWSGAALKVYVVTGASLATPVGATGNNSTAVNNSNVAAYTSTGAGSRGFLVAVEYTTGSPTSTDDFTAFGDSSHFWGLVAAKAANTPTAGTSVTFNLDAAGSGTADWQWAAIEVLTGSVDANVTPDPVTATASVPTPTVAYGAGAHPDPVTAAATVPDPGVSAGVNAHPDPVTATTTVPTVSVSTEPTELVSAGPVTATTTVPAPGVSADASTTLTAVTATTAVLAPTVRVDATVIMGVVAVSASVPGPVVDAPILPGDKVTRAGQAEWQGFLLGSGTPYSWQELTGWRTLPPVVSGNVDQPLGHGSYDGQPYLAERTVTWATLIKAARTEIGRTVRDLELATGISTTEDPGSLVIWDFDDDQPYLVYGHLTQREPGPVNRQARLGLSRGVIQWVCSDPRRYSVVRYSAVIPLDVETAVLNDGNTDTPEILRIPGPATTPQIDNLTLDRVVGFDITVPDGQTLEIDTKHGTVVLNGDDELSTLIEGSTSIKDFVLGPGPNTLLYSTASGGTAGAAVLWRHAIA